MITSVTDAAPTQAAAPVAPVSQRTAPTKSDSTDSGAAKADSVALSSTALAAMKEATETPAQTAKEAGGGDMQAKHLLAKEAAAKAEE